MGEGV